MRSYLRFACLLSIALGCFTTSLQGQQMTPNRSLPSSSGPRTTTPTAVPQSTIPSSHHTPSASRQPAGSRNSALPPGRAAPSLDPATNLISTYFHPGMLVQRGAGQWEGGDHLFNLNPNIGVYVELIKPQDDEALNFNQESIQRLIEGLFTASGITPKTMGGRNQPPLPFFQVRVMLYPVTRGYVACCDGRLFESVVLNRINFDPGMSFQAITWEKASLIVAPTETINAQIEHTVTEIAQAFTERFQAFEQRRRDIMGDRR